MMYLGCCMFDLLLFVFKVIHNLYFDLNSPVAKITAHYVNG